MELNNLLIPVVILFVLGVPLVMSRVKVPDLPNRSLSRLYLSSRNPAVLYAHAITDRGNRTAPVNYCEFVTVFGDTLAVTTTNAPRISAFPPIPENPSQSLPNVRDGLESGGLHRRRTGLGVEGPPQYRGLTRPRSARCSLPRPGGCATIPA